MKAPPPHLWMYSNNLHMVIEYEIQIQIQPTNLYLCVLRALALYGIIKGAGTFWNWALKGECREILPHNFLSEHTHLGIRYSRLWLQFCGDIHIECRILDSADLDLDNNDFLNLIFVDFSKPMFSHILFID